jgi:cytochrome oxidase assembly protein ShyY1
VLRIALRPRWIAALILALAVAAGFALLSQWQLSRSVTTGMVVERPTETVLPLADVATPQKPLPTVADGQLVTVTGDYVEGDTVVLSDRLNRSEPGYWVVAHLRSDGAGVAVAVGWTSDEATAKTAAAAFAGGPADVTGRLVADEGPQTGDFQNGGLSTLSLGALVNIWADADPAGVYNGYIVSDIAAPTLERIYAPTPQQEVELNWLNLFYAAEWVIFAGFAIFLWWRLVRDVYLKEAREASVD